MLGGLGSDWIRVAGYALAAAAAVWAGWRELPGRHEDPRRWPAFWFVAGALLLAMAIGRGGDVGDAIAELGRREAWSSGWYDRRRELQELLIAGIIGVTFIAGLIMLWRTPERRERFVPLALVMFAIVSFAGIRLVSLHDVDAALSRLQVAGLRLGAVVELTIIATMIAMTLRAQTSMEHVQRES